MQDPTPWVGGVEPFLMHTSSQFRSAGPLALTSSAYTAEFNEVKALGAINSTTRTTEQTYITKWWQFPDHERVRQPSGPATRTFTTFSQALDEIVEARIWAGLHFRTADVQGQVLGMKVARYMQQHYFQPVD